MGQEFENIGISANPARKMRQGHIMRRSYDVEGVIIVYCDGPGCGFTVMRLLEDKEDAEYKAYIHRTEPQLLLPGTSDIFKTTRLDSEARLALARELLRKRSSGEG